MEKLMQCAKNFAKLMVLTVVFIGANSACTFFIHQDVLPESADDMKMW